jgi:hypothetical protein
MWCHYLAAAALALLPLAPAEVVQEKQTDLPHDRPAGKIEPARCRVVLQAR